MPAYPARLCQLVLLGLIIAQSAFAQREVRRLEIGLGGGPFTFADDVDGDMEPDVVYWDGYNLALGFSGGSGSAGALPPGSDLRVLAGGSDCDGNGGGDCLVACTTYYNSAPFRRILQLRTLPTFAVLWERQYDITTTQRFADRLIRCSDVNRDGADDFAVVHLEAGVFRTEIMSGRNGVVLLTIPGYGASRCLEDFNGDGIRELKLDEFIYDGATGQRLRTLSAPVGPIGIRSSVRSGLFDLVEVEGGAPLRRTDGITGALVWSRVHETPGAEFDGYVPGKLGDVDSDDVDDFLVRARNASGVGWIEARSGADGDRLWSLAGNQQPQVIHGLPGYFARLELPINRPFYAIVVYSAFLAGTPIPLRCDPGTRDWRTGGIIEVRGVFPACD
ncbi:MAG: hypothetical protein IPN34_01705 [Planctomycetes bacterium]|nr:hypothetical protein [Planctomycetota bacterium]